MICENTMNSDTKCNPILQNPDLLRKLYNLLNIKDMRKLFMVCKHTASSIPQVKEFTIDEETYKKYKKFLTHNRCSIEKIKINIQRPFSKELKIPDVDMTKLSEITIRTSGFTSYYMEKIFNINKITKCNNIDVLEFLFLFAQQCPKFIIRAEDKKIKNLKFSCGSMILDEGCGIPSAIKLNLSLEIQNTSIERLLIESIAVEPEAPISVETLFMSQEYFLPKKDVKIFKREVNGIKFVISYGHFPFFLDEDEGIEMNSEEFIAVNTIRLNGLLRRIDNKSLKQIYFRGFLTYKFTVLDLRDFENLKHVQLELLILEEEKKMLLTNEIEVRSLEECVYFVGGEDGKLTVLTPPDGSFKVDLRKVYKNK
jgi:hypothetical protein